MIDQITVFLENSKGRLVDLCTTVGDAGVNMYALTIAETSDYGLIRIICDKPELAVQTLKDKDFRATRTKVIAVELANEPGGLAGLLKKLDELDINIEYAYCFYHGGDKAVDVLRVHGAEKAIEAIQEAGYKLLTQEDLAK